MTLRIFWTISCYGKSSRLLWEGTSSRSTAHTVELTLMGRVGAGVRLWRRLQLQLTGLAGGCPLREFSPVGKYIFHSVCCSFTLLIMFFEVQRYLILWSLSIFFSVTCAFSITFKKPLLSLKSWRFSCIISSMIVLAFKRRSFIHFWVHIWYKVRV